MRRLEQTYVRKPPACAWVPMSRRSALDRLLARRPASTARRATPVRSSPRCQACQGRTRDWKLDCRRHRCGLATLEYESPLTGDLSRFVSHAILQNAPVKRVSVPSAPNLKFASLCSAFRSELQIRNGTSKFMILVWFRFRSALEALAEKMKRTSEPPH
jgi:hypothetical protein